MQVCPVWYSTVVTKFYMNKIEKTFMSTYIATMTSISEDRQAKMQKSRIRNTEFQLLSYTWKYRSHNTNLSPNKTNNLNNIWLYVSPSLHIFSRLCSTLLFPPLPRSPFPSLSLLSPPFLCSPLLSSPLHFSPLPSLPFSFFPIPFSFLPPLHLSAMLPCIR